MGIGRWLSDTSRISRRLIFSIVLFSTLVTVVTTAIQLFFDYRRDLLSIRDEMHEIKSVHLEILEKNLWLLNGAQIQAQLDGIERLKNVEYVAVYQGTSIGWSSGNLRSGQVISTEFPLVFRYPSKNHQIGVLKIVASLDNVYWRLLDKTLVILVTNALKTFLVAGFMLALFQYAVTRHLIKIARFARNENAQNTFEPLCLDRSQGRGDNRDELDDVACEINRMTSDLRSNLDALQAICEALQKSEERYAFAVSGTADGLWDWNIQQGEYYLSPRWKEILGYQDHELENRLETFTGSLHPDDHDRVRSEVQAHLDKQIAHNLEYRLRCKNGSYVWIHAKGQAIWDEAGKPLRMAGSISDITERKQSEEAFSYQASHDALTGLINRHEFERRLARVLDTKHALTDEHAFCYLDLDHFKVVNDTSGHVAGDELLRQVGKLLSASVRNRDTLARLGGDEFGLLMEHCSLAQAHRVANTVRKAIENFRFVWDKQVYRIGVSIGLVPICGTGDSVASLMSAADSACYAAKDEGRNRVHAYHLDDTELARRQGHMQWVGRINQALEDNRLQLWSQPIAPIQAGVDQGEHFELLLRLIDERGEIVPPWVFLPAAEHFGLATRIDHWVVGSAFGWLSRNPELLERLHLCCINLSGTSLADEGFLAFIQEQLEQSRIPPQKICFEVTETATIANLSTATTFMETLRARGCRFALDDFGVGLSSFAYLKTLPVDYLKIDGSFVKEIVDDEVSLALVRSINDVGKVMGKRTIAEFVENEAILEKLREIGVDYAQGYRIGRPVQIGESQLFDARTKRMQERVFGE